ncbi:MAG: alpha-amylase family glycosyl hydrolase [Acutalibacteraceae bacterium]
MKRIKTIVAMLLALVLVAGIAVVSTSAATTSDVASTATDQIIVHYYQPSGTPTIYYWNSLPENIETKYPGDAMKSDGNGWYSYTFNGLTKVNMVFVTNGVQSDELTRSRVGEYWYKNNKWTTYDPDGPIPSSDVDMREETIYFVITTRFYDGDTGNNVHCWDDSQAGNPDSDPAWRGDFQGLIDKLDYIKALGFSAIWITPVVTNASGYDYHGYHAFDFATVDVRYESKGATYQDLIDAIHAKDMKIIQDVVWNHTSNFGEAFLGEMFEKVYDDVQDLANIETSMIPNQRLMDYCGISRPEEYYDLLPKFQYEKRLSLIKEDANDTNNYYHHEKSMGYGSYLEQVGQMAGDCVDINTENQVVADYITSTYLEYANMGVDSFRLDTEKHINRWTLNSAYFPAFSSIDGFYIFGEVCARWHGAFNESGCSDSPFFYTWKETDSAWQNNWSTTDWKANYTNAMNHFNAHTEKSTDLTSDNAFLSGNDYHTPDYSKANGTGVIDFGMHWAFTTANQAYQTALEEDKYFNDSTWNVVYVDSHDYSPDSSQTVRYNGGTDAWAENLSLMFTFRGIPCLYYGSEVEFKKGIVIDVGPNAPLDNTGRAYFGDHIEGNVTATDFSEYTASGTVADTLSHPLSKHIQRLNQIRRAIPALQKGQYSTQGVTGNMAYKRGYTDAETGEKSFVCVTVTDSASFTGIPNGTYIDAVTGTTKTVTNGTLSIDAPGKGNIRAYVLCDNGYTGISGKIGTDGTYLK